MKLIFIINFQQFFLIESEHIVPACKDHKTNGVLDCADQFTHTESLHTSQNTARAAEGQSKKLQTLPSSYQVGFGNNHHGLRV